MTILDQELDAETSALLARYGFDAQTFERLRCRLRVGGAEPVANRVSAVLEPPEPGDIRALPPLGSIERATLSAAGQAELAQGRVGMLVLAGGMATRFGGVVKAGVEVLEGHSFLALKLRDAEQVARRVGQTVMVAVMTSFATEAEVTRMLAASRSERLGLHSFPQLISLRLTPTAELFRDRHGRLSPYAPGHGDVVFALCRSGLLARLRGAGVRHLFMSNVDNLAATLDPAVIGAHIESGLALTFELAPLLPGDKGGVPARLDGRLQVIEALRYPEGFVEQSIPWFSTNSFVLDLTSIDRDFPLDWFRVDKQVDSRPAVQFERLINQLTAFLPCQALAIERDGKDGRFLPVKDPPELAARLPLIRAVLGSRGVL